MGIAENRIGTMVLIINTVSRHSINLTEKHYGISQKHLVVLLLRRHGGARSTWNARIRKCVLAGYLECLNVTGTHLDQRGTYLRVTLMGRRACELYPYHRENDSTTTTT